MVVVKQLSTYLATDAEIEARTAGKLISADKLDKVLEDTFDKTTGGTIAGNTSITGNLTVTGDILGLTITPSDSRLKSEYRSIDQPLQKLQLLEGLTYLMKGKDKRQAGVIAQAVLKILPEAVHEFEYEGETYLAVSYSQLVPLLINAIKELDARVTELEKR